MKTFKKVLASTLAAAMVVTALPVTPANAAAAPKLSTKKATVYVGQSKTIKVTTPKAWKSVKVKATTSKKSVATVKASKKKVTVKAVKAGTAKVTVKVTGKKSGKAVKKTLKATITVKNPSLTLTATSTEVAVGAKETVKATVKPASTKVTFSSSDDTIATVDAATGEVTGVKAGDVTITAKAGKTTKTVKMSVKTYIVKSVKQTKADTFEAVVLGKTSDLKASDVTVSNKTTNAVYAVKSVAVDEKDATKVTITTFTEFTDGATYVVTVAGTAVEVVVSDGVVADVTVSPVQIPANTDGTEIKAQTVDKNGVVLKDFTTESKPNNVDFSLATTQGYVNGTKLVLPVVGNKGTAEVTYHTYKYDENAKEVGAITKKVDITAVAEEVATVAGYNYTIAKDAPDWTKAVTTVSKFALGDSVKAYFHFVNTKKKDITADYSVVSSDDSVLLLPETSLKASQNVSMVAVKTGTAYINVLKDGKVVTSLPVTVTETRKLVNISLDKTALSVSTKATNYTTGSVVVKGVDQYGEEIPVDTVVPTVLTKDSANVTAKYVSADKKVNVDVANAKKGTYVIKIEAQKGNDKVAKTITVNAVETTKTADDATDLRLELSDSKVDAAIANDTTADKAAKKVTATVAAYDQGVKVGVVSGASFTLNDKTEKIDASAGTVDVVTVSSSNKATKVLSAGTYVVKATVVTKDAKGNNVTKTFSGSFEVVDTQASATVKINSKKTTKTDVADILAETCVASYNGTEYTTFAVDSKEVKTSGGYTYIGKATVTVKNSKGVEFDVTVNINTTFTR